MKSQFLRASSLVALTLLVALGLPSIAQERRQQPPVKQEELQIRELAVQEIDAEALRIRVPRECERLRPEIQIHDVADNFSPPGSPVALSSALSTFVAGKPLKGYDDTRADAVFADSFKLRSCRVCYATLEFQVRHQPGVFNPVFGNYSNDSILAGAAPFTTALRFIGPASIWTADLPNPKTVTLGITPAGLTNLNSYLSTGPMPPSFDVIAQDDTEFDYVKLSVWYY